MSNRTVAKTSVRLPLAERVVFDAARDPMGPVLARPEGCQDWSPRHWESVESGYCYWLDWLDAMNQFDPDERPGLRCTPERLRGYVEHLLKRLSPGTALHLLRQLRSYFKAFDPDFAGRHLRDADRHLRRRLREIGIKHVPPLDAFDKLGVELMHKGRMGCDSRHAVNFVTLRDGLEFRAMAHRSLRRLNFTEITLGPYGDLRKIGSKWWLVVQAAKTKMRNSIRQPWPDELVADLEEYLTWRTSFLEGVPPTDRLWISYRRTPQGPGCVSEAFSRRTSAKFEKPYRTHALRLATGTGARSAAKGATMLGNTPAIARLAYRNVNKAAALRDFHDGLGEGMEGNGLTRD